MPLRLKRPLAFIDLETTGTNLACDHIIEIAIVRLNVDSTRQIKRKLLNPGIPIPAGSTDVHGYTDEMVKDAPTFKQVANEIKQFIENCDLCGYNSNRFDVPMLVEEFLRAGLEFDITHRKLVDVQKIFHQMEQRTLAAAYRFYCDKNLDGAHTAEADAVATWEVLEAQITRYPQLGESVETILGFLGEDQVVDLARRFVMEKGIEVFNFGKHKGKPVAEILKAEPQYYDWMMKGEFPLHTKQKLTEILNRTLLKKG
ncbi:MAG TPA: 3'-5' exonuclease [Chitinophagaceae bacterium]